jgi:hypothetical protein
MAIYLIIAAIAIILIVLLRKRSHRTGYIPTGNLEDSKPTVLRKTFGKIKFSTSEKDENLKRHRDLLRKQMDDFSRQAREQAERNRRTQDDHRKAMERLRQQQEQIRKQMRQGRGW